MKKDLLRRLLLLAFCFAATVLTGCALSGIVMSGTYENAEEYQSGNFTYTASNVTKINVSWYNGSVALVYTDGDTLSVSESGKDLSVSESLHWVLKEDTLQIEFCESGYVGKFSKLDKKLTVEVPSGIDLAVVTTSAGIAADVGTQNSVSLQATSGTIELANVTANGAIKLSTTSGDIKAKCSESEDLTAETTSGAIRAETISARGDVCMESTGGSIRAERIDTLNGTVSLKSNSGSLRADTLHCGRLTAQATSGAITLGLYECENVTCRSTSGSVRLDLAQNFGATVSIGTTSGSFGGSGYRTENGNRVWGNGSCTVEIQTTSGNITIKQGE